MTTVLVVDDEPAVRSLLRTMLLHAGMGILEACDASEALEILDRPDASVQLVVTDVQMPGIKGFELARRIKRVCPEMPILIISGYIDDEPESEFPLLRKPFRTHELLGAVHSLLQECSSQ